MKVSLSVQEALSGGGGRCDDRAPDVEVQVIDVRDAADDFLCRLFVQPTERGCHLQVDGRPAPEDRGFGASMRVASLNDVVLVGVERAE